MASGREPGDEYVWRFALEPSEPNPTEGDLIVGFVRKTLRELLDFIVLTRDGQEVKVDGFRCRANRRGTMKSLVTALNRGYPSTD